MKTLIHFIKGLFIGVALVVPGLSGSIFAVSVGLYDQILYAVNDFWQNKKETVVFLVPIAAGAVVGIVLSAKLILNFCLRHPTEAYLVFTGLVLGSVPMVVQKIKQKKVKPFYFAFTIIAFSLMQIIAMYSNPGGAVEISLNSLQSFSDFSRLFGAGVFCSAMMSIPGVSGAIMLMIVKQYGNIYFALSSVSDIFRHFTTGDLAAAATAIGSTLILIPFMAGAAVGFLLAARVLGFLFTKYSVQVYYAVAGILAAAVLTLLNAGLPSGSGYLSYFNASIYRLLIYAICIGSGFVMTVFLDD